MNQTTRKKRWILLILLLSILVIGDISVLYKEIYHPFLLRITDNYTINLVSYVICVLFPIGYTLIIIKLLNAQTNKYLFFVGMGIIIFYYKFFTISADNQPEKAISRGSIITPAVVLGKTNKPSSCRITYAYRYPSLLVVSEEVSPTNFNSFTVGDTILIEYATEKPQYSRIFKANPTTEEISAYMWVMEQMEQMEQMIKLQVDESGMILK